MPQMNVIIHCVIGVDFVKPFLDKASRFDFDEEKRRMTGAPEIRVSSNEGQFHHVLGRQRIATYQYVR